jgi:hypothetical protein
METILDTMGWLGGVMLACCALPETYLAWKQKYSHLSWGMLFLWGGGEILILIPVCLKFAEPFLIFNYLLNIILIGIICYYKHQGGKKDV